MGTDAVFKLGMRQLLHSIQPQSLNLAFWNTKQIYRYLDRSYSLEETSNPTKESSMLQTKPQRDIPTRVHTHTMTVHMA